LIAAPVLADVCLTVYPTGDCYYAFDESEYYLVSSGDPLYDAAYDRGGFVLIDSNNDQVAFDIYQAPGLTGFQVSENGQEGYFFEGTEFTLIIDGFSNAPTTYTNIKLVMEPGPDSCPAEVMIDGSPVGDVYDVGDLVVSTPAQGNNYSDTITVNVEWGGCDGFQAWAFSDENFNLHRDGGECFTAFSHDVTVPVEATTWGGIRGAFGR